MKHYFNDCLPKVHCISCSIGELIKLSEYTYKDYRFLGISQGGIQTCIHLPQFRLLFDIGCGGQQLTEVPRLLLSHGHLDHSSGLAYYISQRNLRRLAPADIYVPPALAEPLRKILDLWCEIEDYQTKYNLHSVDYENYYPLQGNYYFKGLPSIHRVASNGYIIFEKTRKLKQEFQRLSGKEIAQLKKERDDLFYENYLPLIVFSGDTQIEFVLKHECVRSARVLFLECTYIDEARTVEQTRHWGHLHLDEIVKHAEAFRDIQQLFLIHFSPRYAPEKISKTLKEKLPDWLSQKTIPFLSKREGRSYRARRA